MKEMNSQIKIGGRFAFGVAAVIAALLLPIHPSGPTRAQVVISGLIALAAVVAMAVQTCRDRLWHRIVAGVLLLVAIVMVIGMIQEWIELPR